MSRPIFNFRKPAEPIGEFPVTRGVDYLEFLGLMHKKLTPAWYLEIGTRDGASFKQALGNSIAVDPDFQISSDITLDKPQAHFYQMASDAFFAGNFAEKHCEFIDFAFLDGMHLFEFLLRDFIGAEKLSNKDTAIVMHDCIPMTEIASERVWDFEKTTAWTGDVWKLIPILKSYRPDLNIDVMDCPPSGLTIVTNLDAENTVLESNYDEIVAKYMKLSIADYGLDKLTTELAILDSRSSAASKYIGRWLNLKTATSIN